MPISPSTLTNLKNITTTFDFLLTASNPKLKSIPPDHRICAICQSPFDNNTWQSDGDTVNRPVKLECGHIFGIQCLAHLVFTSDFQNRCPLCRAQVIPESFVRNPSAQSWKAAVPLLRVLMMFGADMATYEKKKVLDVLLNGLEKEGLVGSAKGKHMHRIMVIYEEFLNQLCDHPQPIGDAERARNAEGRVQGLMALIRETAEIRRQRDELRELRAQQEEVARYEKEKELTDVKVELVVAKVQLRNVRVELEASKGDLEITRNAELEAQAELEDAKKVLKDVSEELSKTLKKLDDTKKNSTIAASLLFYLVFLIVVKGIAVDLISFLGDSYKISATSLATLWEGLLAHVAKMAWGD